MGRRRCFSGGGGDFARSRGSSDVSCYYGVEEAGYRGVRYL